MRNLSAWRRPSKECVEIATDPRRELNISQHGALVVETLNLLASAKDILQLFNLDADTTRSLSEVIAQGKQLDHRLEQWSINVEDKYKYKIIQPLHHLLFDAPVSSQVLSSIHIYSSSSMAHLWNIHRGARLLLLQCIRRCIMRKTDYETSHLVVPSPKDHDSKIIEQISGLIDDTCASVPYLLGEVDQGGNLQLTRTHRALGAYFLLWPLRAILWQESITPAQKTWITKRLEYIKNLCGLQAAMHNLPP